MTLRPITHADVPALFTVRVATHESRLSRAQLAAMGITETSVAAGLRGDRQGWLTEIDGRVVGFAMGDRATGELLVIAVLPEFVGRGLGSALLGAVERFLEQAGCRRLWLTTDVDPALKAYRFYRQHGWRDDRIEGDTRYMVKPLRTAVARQFFDLQVDVAERVTALAGLPIEQALLRYTNLYVRFDLGRDFDPNHPVWRSYVAGVCAGKDLRDWTWAFYRDEVRGDGGPAVAARFGCFAYARAADGRIRLHFLNAEPAGVSPLASARQAERQADLTALFTHIRRTEEGPTRVAGTSWLYNIEAYRRLFPPAYLASARMVASRFQRMALWGQLLNHQGEVKAGLAGTFRERLAALPVLDRLGACFPFEVFAVEAPVKAFYDFYGVQGLYSRHQCAPED